MKLYIDKFFLIFLTYSSVPHTGARSPSHRFAVAGVFDELGCVLAFVAADGDGGVTGRFDGFLWHG